MLDVCFHDLMRHDYTSAVYSLLSLGLGFEWHRMAVLYMTILVGDLLASRDKLFSMISHEGGQAEQKRYERL